MKTPFGSQIKDTEKEKLKLEYWYAFIDYVDLRDQDRLLPAMVRSFYRVDFRPYKLLGVHYSCTISVNNWIGVQLYLDGNLLEQNKSRYDFIEGKCKSQIDTFNCKMVEWKRRDDKKSSCINIKLDADFKDKSDWQRQIEWMYNTMMELHKIVKPYYGDISGI